MKFICEGVVLSDAAAICSKACATKTLVPALECIKIAAYNDSVALLAYDGEISIEKVIKAEILEEGETLVNGRFFADFIAKIFDKTVSVSVSDKGMEIKYDDSKSTMAVLPASDFPHIKKENTDQCVKVKESEFKKLIAKTVFCSATDESRPILKGCLLEAKGNELQATALDGFRMAVSSVETTEETNAKLICPARTLNEISKMMEGKEEEIELRFSKNTLSVQIDDVTLTSRLYAGEFINKANIFPPEFETKFTVKKSELLSCVERAAVLIRGDKNNLIVLDIKNGGVLVSANSDIGKMAETVKGELDGKEIKIAMNGKFLTEALKAADGEIAVMSFNTPVSPFTVVGQGDENSEYLILPVRVNS